MFFTFKDWTDVPKLCNSRMHMSQQHVNYAKLD